MKINKLLLFAITMILLNSCEMYKKANTPQNSFLPMAIGNLWKINEQNYTRIEDTASINGKRYYKFHSLIGGDAVDIKYLRLDDKDQLLESFPDQPEKIYTHAKFNAAAGEEFYTLKDQSENDYRVKVIEKTKERMTFEFEMVYHKTLKGSKHTISYIRGLGYDGNWRQIIINGKNVGKN